MNTSIIKKALLIIAIVFYIISGVMLYKGYDKMTNYYNSEYSTSHNVNAYVGGDAYNYIINGNYATGFFVLSMGFMLAGTIFLTSDLIITAIHKSEQNDSILMQQGEIISE